MADGPALADFIAAFPLFRDPILAGAAAGAVLGYLGVFIVLRRMVFASATLSQGASLGVVLAFVAQIHLGLAVPPLAGAIAISLATAGLLSLRAERIGLSRESVLALLWLGCGGGAVLLADRITQEAHDISSILFGSAVLVRTGDLVQIGIVGGLALAVGLAAHRALVFAGIDPDGARVQGLPVRALEAGLLGLVTLVVAVCTRALGALPVFAFSVLPALAALLAARDLRRVFPLALVGGALAGVGGYLFAFFFSFPVGASQVAAALALVLLALPVRLLRRSG